jgi:hypothetical protein
MESFPNYKKKRDEGSRGRKEREKRKKKKREKFDFKNKKKKITFIICNFKYRLDSKMVNVRRFR